MQILRSSTEFVCQALVNRCRLYASDSAAVVANDVHRTLDAKQLQCVK